jgi:hypothetical protein
MLEASKYVTHALRKNLVPWPKHTTIARLMRNETRRARPDSIAK